MTTCLWITSHAHLDVEEVEKKAEATGHERKDGRKTVVATNVGKNGRWNQSKRTSTRTNAK